MLTKEQIEYLFAFCRKHWVNYYDVQIELVDHLANAIEDKIAANPKLAFEEALTQTHKSFGVRGFAPVVQEKQRAIERQSRRLLLQLFKQQFRWPKIILALMIFTLSFSLAPLLPNDYFDITIMIAIIIIMVIIAIAGYSLQRLEKKSGHKFLLLQYQNALNCAFLPLNLMTAIQLFPNEHKIMLNKLGTSGHLIGCLLLTLFVIMAVATCRVFKNIKQTLLKNYPEVFQIAA